jgi:hypothetical protein
MQKYTIAILIALSFGSLSTFAQPRLSPEQLKAFEGYYRDPQNKEMVVHVLVQRDTLVVKPLWSDFTAHLLPKGDLVFQSIEAVERGPIDIAFSRDSTGDIAAIDLGNTGDKWNRDKDYKPVVKKEMEHTPAQLKPYEGVYRLDHEGERFLEFFVKDNNLILKQLWDGTEIPFHPENTEDFYTEKISIFSLHFTKDQTGNVTQVLAFGHDLWVKTKPPGFSAATLGAASGKYQSKDDPDNQVTISVRNNELVVKQGWDGQEITLQALTETYFYNPDKAYKLQLHKDDKGKVSEIVLLETSVFVRLPQ